MALFFKGLVWALLVIAISIIGKSKYQYLAGLLPLFPTFAVIAHLSVYSQAEPGKLNDVILFGFLSLIPYSAYLFSMLILNSYKIRIDFMLLISFFAWCLFASLIFYFWKSGGH